MGLVLKGTSPESGEPVAIKIILPDKAIERRDKERFRREASTMAGVRHPNVVGLLDRGKSGRFNFLILEWIDGPSLRQVIAEANQSGKPTAFKRALRWFEQMCRGLAAIHRVGLVHRDIKPSNILIAPGGVARITDFGIAKADGRHVDFLHDNRLCTRDLRVHGTGADQRDADSVDWSN